MPFHAAALVSILDNGTEICHFTFADRGNSSAALSINSLCATWTKGQMAMARGMPRVYHLEYCRSPFPLDQNPLILNVNAASATESFSLGFDFSQIDDIYFESNLQSTATIETSSSSTSIKSTPSSSSISAIINTTNFTSPCIHSNLYLSLVFLQVVLSIRCDYARAASLKM